jgi:hypothetical protein
MMSSDKPRIPPPSAEGIRRGIFTSMKIIPSESNLSPVPWGPSVRGVKVDSIAILLSARPEVDGETIWIPRRVVGHVLDLLECEINHAYR